MFFSLKSIALFLYFTNLNMKKLFNLSLILSILCLSYSNTRKNEFPDTAIQTNLLTDIDTCISTTNHFIDLIQNNNTIDFIKEYKKLRSNYKKIETYIVFRYPTIDKAINGGPVPSMTRDVVILHKDEPTGLQVIEELIIEKTINKQEILRNLVAIQKNLITLKNSISKLPILNWEILEANHLSITRMITLSLSGFDSPALLLSIQDSKIVLGQIQKDLTFFKPYTSKNYDWNKTNDLIQSTIQYLNTNTDFNSLDRYDLYRNYLLPIQKAIKQLHIDTGYEFYNEVTSIKRSIGKGEHLFSETYLDPHYSMKGNNTNHNQQQIDLGKILFFDPILSKDNNFSCASCHNPSKAFTDGVDKSYSSNLKDKVKRNSPTLVNACFQNNFFLDLRSSDMNDQIMNVILNKDEFNTTPDEIVLKLRRSDTYQKLFKAAYFAHGTPITISTVKSSLELYVRSLVNINSKFDKNIRGNENTLTKEEIDGANLFLGKAACATCHFAPNFNGFVPPHYQDTEGEILGVLNKPDGDQIDLDNGMYDRFKNAYPEAYYIKGMFKTPTIRNIELTGPYMHNGKYNTLEEVIDFYNHGGASGKGLDLPQQTLSSDSLNLTTYEKKALVSFMKTLTDTTGTIVKPFDLPKFGVDSLDNRIWGGLMY